MKIFNFNVHIYFDKLKKWWMTLSAYYCLLFGWRKHRISSHYCMCGNNMKKVCALFCKQFYLLKSNFFYDDELQKLQLIFIFSICSSIFTVWEEYIFCKKWKMRVGWWWWWGKKGRNDFHLHLEIVSNYNRFTLWIRTMKMLGRIMIHRYRLTIRNGENFFSSNSSSSWLFKASICTMLCTWLNFVCSYLHS